MTADGKRLADVVCQARERTQDNDKLSQRELETAEETYNVAFVKSGLFQAHKHSLEQLIANLEHSALQVYSTTLDVDRAVEHASRLLDMLRGRWEACYNTSLSVSDHESASGHATTEVRSWIYRWDEFCSRCD
jgi:hypothetical protein